MNRWTTLLHTSLLMAGMVTLSALVGLFVAGPWGLAWGVGMALLLAGIGQAPPDLFLKVQGARPLLHFEAPGIHATLRELARRADLSEVPGLYLLPSFLPNAFTVGGRRSGRAVAISEGLLRLLGTRELTGVLAHEVSHIRNGDTTVLSIAGAISHLTGLFALFGQFLLFINLPLVLLDQAPFSWALVLVLLSAPTLSTLLLLGLSRTREFAADQEASRITGDPEGLAKALARLEIHQQGLLRRLLLPGSLGQGHSLYRTHPPSEERIRRLLQSRREDGVPPLRREPGSIPMATCGRYALRHLPTFRLTGI